MTNPAYFIGIISGTSIDAVDCALVQFANNRPQLIATLSYPYDPLLRKRIFQLCANEIHDLKVLGETDIEIGRTFAAAANAILQQEKLQPAAIRAIGSHGQTVYHHPRSPSPFTTQLGDPNTIAFLTGITTVADFRRMDMAAGGQGAPLAPLFHQQVFGSAQSDRVVLNVGGIANVSILARNKPFLGFDTGPGNVLMDYWINETQQLIYDDGGRFAASGTVNADLLQLLLDDEYFSRQPPKSTGRELFNGAWLRGKLAKIDSAVGAADIQATLLELTAWTISSAIREILEPDAVFVCGGGAFNSQLMNRLAQLLPQSEVETTAALGMAPDWVEAATFAWLAKQRMDGIPTDARSITGASQLCLLGGIYSAG